MSVFDQNFYFQLENLKSTEISIIFYISNSLNVTETPYLQATIPLEDITKQQIKNFPLVNFDFVFLKFSLK